MSRHCMMTPGRCTFHMRSTSSWAYVRLGSGCPPAAHGMVQTTTWLHMLTGMGIRSIKEVHMSTLCNTSEVLLWHAIPARSRKSGQCMIDSLVAL